MNALEAITLFLVAIVGAIIWAMVFALLTGKWTLLFAQFLIGGVF